MPTNFATRFANAAAPNLIREFGEPLTYNPSGENRSINGMVTREYAQIIAEAGDVPESSMIVRVENDATTGISSEEIDTGGDEISIPLRVGESTVTKQIVQLLNDNGGLTRFLVQ